jgi:allantoicase
MTDFIELIDLVGERLGGAAVVCNDEFFAEKENLVKPAAAVFLPDEYTDRGKWMDGWESRRRRVPGHDLCILRLGAPGVVRGVVVDTSHFKGNYPEQASLEGAYIEGYPSDEELLADTVRWHTIVPRSDLSGDQENRFAAQSDRLFTHVRLCIFPDGGVARLRVHGEPVIHFGRLPAGDGLVDLALATHGGAVTACSDMFFGPRHNLIMPGDARNMGEGWETRRRRHGDRDWVIVRLAASGIARRIEIDTSHFKGNAPGRCLLEATDRAKIDDTTPWWPVLEAPLRRHTRHFFIDEVRGNQPASHVRLTIFPDGGVARLRVHCELSPEERQARGVRWLDALPEQAAQQKLLACCGASRFAEKLAAGRPVGTLDALLGRAEQVWTSLSVDDHLEAFAAHPRIGEKKVPEGQSARWSASEQSQAQSGSAEILAELSELNRRYADKFGFVFLIRAAGRSASEILDALRQRLENDRATELGIAAAQQQQITELRLRRLISS